MKKGKMLIENIFIGDAGLYIVNIKAGRFQLPESTRFTA